MRLQIVWKNGWAHVDGAAPDGTRIRRALKTRDAGRAEEARARLEARLWKVGLYGAEHVITFDECALAYAEDGGETRYLVPVTAELKGRRLKEITPKDIRDMARKLYPNAAPATRNRQAICPARAVINFGHKQGWCGAIKVDGFKVQQVTKTAVDRSYIDALRPHMPNAMFVLLLFLHTTGRRVSDAINLQVAEVDLQNRRARISDPKNGEPTIAWLTAEVAELMAALMPDAGKAFPYASHYSIYPTLRRAAKKAGLPYLPTHQLGRHSYATALDNAGFSTKAIAEAGGWKSPALVAKTYIHPNAAGESAAMVFGKNPSRKSATVRKIK